VVLALATAIAIRVSDNQGLVTPHLVRTPSPGPSGMYVEVMVPGPVDRDERVAMAGENGTRAEAALKEVSDPQTEIPDFPELAGKRSVVFTVHIHNTGRSWISSRLDIDARVLDATGTNYPANQMLSLAGGPVGSTDPEVNSSWQLNPNWQVDRRIAFTVPQNAELTRLHIAMFMGGSTQTAEWRL
jgi:hypothetical protein